MAGTLDYLLLFLVTNKVESGYAIRRLFVTTPVGRFSDSPGAIYPALARLEKRGWVRSSAEQGGRRKRVFTTTTEGQAALRAWLNEPLGDSLIERQPDELALRYVMVAEHCSADETRAFLDKAAEGLERRLERLEAYLEGAHGLTGAALEATLHGADLVKTDLRWLRSLRSRWRQQGN